MRFLLYSMPNLTPIYEIDIDDLFAFIDFSVNEVQVSKEEMQWGLSKLCFDLTCWIQWGQ